MVERTLLRRAPAVPMEMDAMVLEGPRRSARHRSPCTPFASMLRVVPPRRPTRF
jgi:hypothetical protein